jgi:protein involved in polysaccharide export with SLBB domain
MHGQTIEGGMATTLPTASAASYYYVAKPGEFTIQVNVWGDVQKPGRYEVARSTDLVQLLSYAGGPTREANLSDVRVTRFLSTETGVQRTSFTVNLDDFVKVDQTKLVLHPGDAVFVDYVTRLNIRDVFAVVTTAALVTAAVAQMIYANHH